MHRVEKYRSGSVHEYSYRRIKTVHSELTLRAEARGFVYAFACSSNTFGQVRVAAQFSTNFISASAAKGELIAEGETIHHSSSFGNKFLGGVNNGYLG